ncbi:hypothetical protein BG000_011123 [Podila horticola]|nr:hypothetical protein BG000_011123 [Podila horticola]
MCFGFGSIYGSDDFDSIDGRDSDYWEPNGATSPIAPYQSLYQVVIGVPQEVDYGFHSTCQEDRQYERDVGWNSGNYNTSYYWARYFDGNRPVPCSSVGPFDRLPHYRRDWWYRSLFKEGLTGLVPVIGSIVCLFMSYVYVARPLSLARLRPEQLRKLKVTMWKLLAIDFFIGLIFPIGPFLRAWFHCNMRIIHFAFDAKNEHESYVDYLYYQNSGRIRVADLNKARAMDALKMHQQYHQECVHTFYGADLMNATDHAVLHEDLARLQRELSQARTCQFKMENERIKSCNAAQPLIRRTMSNPEAIRCYHAIPPTAAWSDQGVGVGPSVFLREPEVQYQQFIPQQGSSTSPPLVSSQPISSPQQPVAPIAAPPQPIAPRQVFAPQQPTPFQQAAPFRRNTPVPLQSVAPRSAVARPQRTPAIYQPMPPRRQALVLYDSASRPGMFETRHLMYASRQMAPRPAFDSRQVAPRSAVALQALNARQGGLAARKAVAPPPPMPAMEIPVTYQQAIAAQQALSSQEAVIPHQPLVIQQADVLGHALVFEQVIPEQAALKLAAVSEQSVVLAQTDIPEQTVAASDPTVGVVPAPISASPIDCAVNTSVHPDPIILEAALVSPSTIQAYMTLMLQRMVQADQFNPSSVAPTATRRKRSFTPSMLRNFCLDPPCVSPAINESNAIRNGETASTTPSREVGSPSCPLKPTDQSLAPKQRHTALDTRSLTHIVIDASNGFQDAQDALPEGQGRPLNDAGVSGHAVNDLVARQMSSSLESDVTATEPEEQAIWEIQCDSEDVYGDDEAEDDSSDDDDSEDDGHEGDDGGSDEEKDVESGGDSGNQDECDDNDDSGDDSDDPDDEDDYGDDESTDDYSTEEYDYSEPDKEEHYQILVRNFSIAPSLNKANNRSISRLSTLEFSESSLASRGHGIHQHCYDPSPGLCVSTLKTSGVGRSDAGGMPVLGVSVEHNPEHGVDTPPGLSYPQVSNLDSETSSLERAIEKVLSRLWKLENRNRQPQRLISGPRFDID